MRGVDSRTGPVYHEKGGSLKAAERQRFLW